MTTTGNMSSIDERVVAVDPATQERHPRDVRWPGVLRAALGPGFEVIEEGLNGRTTLWDDPFEPGRRGLDYLLPCLRSHRPLDLVVVMLYDRLALDLVRARDGLIEGNLHAVHENLVHAQDIVSELHAALDPSKWDAAEQLGELYQFIFDQLVLANVRKDPEIVIACIGLVEPLRDAWWQIAGLGTASPVVGA